MVGTRPLAQAQAIADILAPIDEKFDYLKTFGLVTPGTDIVGGITTTVATIKSLKAGGTFIVPAIGHTFDDTIEIKGDLYGGFTLDGNNAPIKFTANKPAFKLGNITDPGPEYRLYAKTRNLNITGPGIGNVNSSGVFINQTADVYLQGGKISNFYYGLRGIGGLICDFYDLTLRDCQFGFHFAPTTEFAPNSLGFYSLRSINNKRGGYTSSTESGVINFFNSEVEGNNYFDGTDNDGIKCVEHELAGSVNYFGCHFENNPASYGLWYRGADTTKNLTIVGSQILSTAREQVHIERGVATIIASRVTSAGKQGMFFAAGTSGTIIDSETDLNGDLSKVVGIRRGRLGFGRNPVDGEPVISMSSANIASASNIATNFSNDTILMQFQSTAGTRTGYIQFTASGSQILHNDNNNAGWTISTRQGAQLFAGRGGVMALEPGSDNVSSLGSGSLRFSQIFSANSVIATSDARAKEEIRDLSDVERAVALKCKRALKAFKMSSSVATKGDKARWHFGIIAQDVRDIFLSEGLNADDYGLFCHDSWEADIESWDDEYQIIPAVYSDDIDETTGQPTLIEEEQRILIRPAGSKTITEAGDRYGIRYEELLAFLIAAL